MHTVGKVALSSKIRPAVLQGLFVSALIVLCSVLGALQYRWIGEASEAARQRLKAGIEGNLARLSRDFNAELAAAGREVMPAGQPESVAELQQEVAARYQARIASVREARSFSRIAIAVPQEGGVRLRIFDAAQGAFAPAPWPAEWQAVRRRIEFFLNRTGAPARPGELPPSSPVLEVPVFAPAGPPGAGPFARRELAWVIFELNVAYVRETLLPELIARHLEAGGGLEYQVAVITRSEPPETIYESSPGAARIARTADAAIPLLDLQIDNLYRRGGGRGPGGGRGGRARAVAPGGPPEMGRWVMVARHRAGSLEAVVARARMRSLAVTAGVLLLLVLTLGALVHFARSSQRLADLQMNFVAGVSHELRTPLTVIHTAAYNLRGRVAQNPAQVERYGELIQKESGRLKELVEQVLKFASANAGRVIHEREPVPVDRLIEEALELSRPVVQAAGCTVEKSIEPGLPPVLADALALKHALQNLIANAVKYGAGEERWIGISAARGAGAHRAVEIRVSDRGPGIPAEEQKHIFDPFFRGRRALDEQIHGTGLGLNLVKKVVEAHGGSIRVSSQEGRGAAFILLIPAAPAQPEVREPQPAEAGQPQRSAI